MEISFCLTVYKNWFFFPRIRNKDLKRSCKICAGQVQVTHYCMGYLIFLFMILSIYLKLDCKLSGVGLGFSICSSETNYIIKITDVWNVIGHKNLQISKIKLEQLRKSGDDELTQSKISWAVAVNMSHSTDIYSSEALCLLSTICRFLILISESKRLSTEQQQLDYQRRVSRKHLHTCFWRLTFDFSIVWSSLTEGVNIQN